MRADAVACAHCGLPVARGRKRDDAQPRYCCFGCSLAAQITGAEGDEGQARWILARLMLGVFLAMNVMLLSLTLYSISVYDVEVTSAMQAVFYSACRWVMLVCGAGVLVLLGIPIARNAVAELRYGRITADLFILTGVCAAWAYSARSTVLGHGDVYFDTATMLLVIVSLGRYLEARARASSGATVLNMLAGAPDLVCRVSDDGEKWIEASRVQVGDRLLVRPGDMIVADGRIETGTADIDESSLTGESLPSAKGPGDEVFAGAINLNGRLVIRVTAAGTDRLLARVMRLLEAARSTRAPAQQLADRVATVLLPATLILAAAVLGVRLWQGDVATGMLSALAVLVVACPCALGIATPLALWISLHEAARRGAIVRSASVVEALAGVDTVVFDKTGTLTDREAQVVDLDCFGDWDRERVLRLAAAAAASSTHPVSAAIVRAAQEAGLTYAAGTDLTEVPGRGVRATHAQDGTVILIGNTAWLEQHGVVVPASTDADAWIAASGVVIAGVHLTETLRKDAKEAIGALTALGKRAVILSGDRASRAAAIAGPLEAEVIAELTPEAKVERIHALRDEGRRVAMIGDGINDAAALACADVGIAMGCGADLTREAADICLVHDHLATVAWLCEYAQRTRRIVRANLAWAIGYNGVALSIAAAGALNPIVAALAMVGSSALVLANSFRLKTAVGARGFMGDRMSGQDGAAPSVPDLSRQTERESVPA